MALFAIADLHLSLGGDKPMDVFGSEWTRHAERLRANWGGAVSPDDTVVIPGDLSWAMDLRSALPDFAFIEALPGRKLIGKGNHDYWWATASKINAFFAANGFKSMELLHNNSYVRDGIAVCGSRGWQLEADPQESGKRLSPEDRKIYDRELLRFEASLREGARSGAPLAAFLHFPPVTKAFPSSGFSELLAKYGAVKCYYGHLHDASIKNALTGPVGGVEYRLISCDAIDFTPVRVGP